MNRILIQSNKCWEYAVDKLGGFSSDSETIAENDETGISINIAMPFDAVVVLAYQHGFLIREECVDDAYECEECVEGFYDDYIRCIPERWYRKGNAEVSSYTRDENERDFVTKWKLKNTRVLQSIMSEI